MAVLLALGFTFLCSPPAIGASNGTLLLDHPNTSYYYSMFVRCGGEI